MKIAVIFTGGTIGSRIKGGYIGIDDKMQYVLLKNYENDNEIIFKAYSPYSILSENLSAKELNLLQNEISQRLSEDFDGIIVTHGTDTLQYTSTAMEYIFGDTEIPIVFVSANYPLEDEKSNGFVNFATAVEFIKSKIATGVFVSYKNQNDSYTTIHIPSQILQHNECAEDIYSIDNSYFARYNGAFILNTPLPQHKSLNTGLVNFLDEPKTLVISSVPGQNYSFSLDDTNAVIIKPYHSSTLNTSNNSFISFCKNAKEKEIPVYVLGSKNDITYESTEVFRKLNITPLPYGTFISAYMKIWIDISI